MNAFQFAIIGLCALMAMIDGMDTQAIGLVAPAIAAEWHASAASFGPVFGSSLFSGLIGALVLGQAGDRAPTAFDPDVNLVSLDSANGEDTSGALAPPVRDTVNLTVLGHPRLRVGQVATISGLSGVPTGSLRLSRVVHKFTITTRPNTAVGYGCVLTEYQFAGDSEGHGVPPPPVYAH